MKTIKIGLKDLKVSKEIKPSVKEAHTPEARHMMIEKEAYHGACTRGFDKSDVLGDWLAAEKHVDSLLAS